MLMRTHTRSRRRGVLSVSVVGLLALSACGSDSAAPSTAAATVAVTTKAAEPAATTTAAPDAPTTEPAATTVAPDVGEAGGAVNDINPQDPASLAPGGTLRWAITEMPPQWNYNHLDGPLDDTNNVLQAVMPYTWASLADASPDVNEDYFTSVKLLSNAPQQIEYTINPKATWSDGTPITIADLTAQWKALDGTNEAFIVASTSLYEDIESIEQGVDERQAIVTMKKVNAEWEPMFNPLFPASLNSDPKAFNEGWLEKPLVTAGPFKFDSIDQTAQVVTVVRDPQWWGTPAVLDSIVFRVLDPDAMGQAFANGELDLLDIGPSVDTFKQAQGVKDAVIRQSLAPNFRHMTFNGAEGALLADPALRVAIQKGIDRQVIAEALVGEIVEDPKPLGNHIFTEGTKYYQRNDAVVEFDPEAAGAALDGLGWVLEGDIRKKDGVELVVRDVIPEGVATSASESQLAQAMLAAIGVKLQIDVVPGEEFFDNYIAKGDFDVTHFSWIGTTTPVLSTKSIYELPKGDDIQQNFGRIGDPKIDELLATANSELDVDKRSALANEADALIWASGHSLLLYQRPNTVATTAKLANYGAFGFQSINYTKIGFMK
jgi:peptide/nickel transport system substrate-binding protein